MQIAHIVYMIYIVLVEVTWGHYRSKVQNLVNTISSRITVRDLMLVMWMINVCDNMLTWQGVTKPFGFLVKKMR